MSGSKYLVNSKKGDMRPHSGIFNVAHSPDDIPLEEVSHPDQCAPPPSDAIPNTNDPVLCVPNGTLKKPLPKTDGVNGLCCSSPKLPLPESNGEVICIQDDVQDVDDNKGEDGPRHTALERQLGIEYAVSDVPPIHMCILFGLQQVLLSISSTISIPLIVTNMICAGDLTLVKSEVMSTFLFMCGVCTILQVTIGVRLPIIQGGCHKFIPAITALMSLEIWQCPDINLLKQSSINGTDDYITEVWQVRMREIQGGIMTASLAQVLIGCTGFLGILLDFLGPITIVPTISLVGISLVDVAMGFCEKHWGITTLTVGLVLLFSLYLRNVRVPFPAYNRKKGCRVIRYPVFMLLPVILAVALSWGFCGILTVTDVLTQPGVRTDSKVDVLNIAKWFYFPYPGQWGMPTVSLASFMAMLAATITSIIESVGDYYACARISGVPPPPAHAVNRGIAIEGFGSLISGAVGSGGATTSYSQNVGAIGFTKVASRWAFFTAGIIFLVSGLCGKFGALLTMLPDPVLGGIVLVSFGMVTSVGLSSLSFVDLSSGRNLCIIGCSLLIGLMIPRYLAENPNAINTGVTDLDQVLKVLLGTAMFVGGVVAFFLDNTVPGTLEERGIIKWRKVADLTDPSEAKGENDNTATDIYSFPCLESCLKKIACCKYVPFMPSFAFRRISPFKKICRIFKRKS